MAVFGCIQPGSPPAYNFRQVDSERWVLDLGYLTADQIVVFLTGVQGCPDGKGVGIYLSRTGEQNFEYIGSLKNERPTGIFKVPVSFLEVSRQFSFTLGLSLDPLASILNLESGGMTELQAQNRSLTYVSLARKLTADLINYITSFVKADPNIGEYLLTPNQVVSSWLNRVVTKLQQDPDWWSKR
eukprot:TRINITY_DN516_c0_g3_i1.p1 TRINITY_DN516_c0_g3~~TRINITY_DN516_c0_g3_i1.p1  ORF type:complete len:205 (+),score=21.88 TRINITY_DN516_c0_g3_i1:63-617(+)